MKIKDLIRYLKDADPERTVWLDGNGAASFNNFSGISTDDIGDIRLFVMAGDIIEA